MRDDVAALAAMTRDSAGPGERAAAQRVAGRLREAGVQDVRVEPFRYQRTYTGATAVHLIAGLAGGPLALAALVSLELEASGRCQWVRRLLPAGEGANAVGRIPATGPRRGTVVLVAHHDAARTGLVWSPRVVTASAARHLRRRSVDGFMVPLAAGLLLAATPARRLGRGLLLAGLAAQADIARSPTVPGASDNATGVAAVLALAAELAADPVPGVEVLVATVGCEEAGMGGMRALLDAHGPFDPATTLVLSLDTLGAGTPIVAAAEGTILPHRYGEADLALADAGAERAGLPPPERWRLGGWTDPILARFRGLRAISLLSMGPGYFPHYHHPSDVPENVDFDCAERCRRIARGTIAAWSETLPSGR